MMRKLAWTSLLSAAVGLALGVPTHLGCNSAVESSKDGVRAVTNEAAPSQPQRAQEVLVGDLSEEMIGQTVAVEGKVTRQCPAAGCWMIVKDHTGEAFIDLKPGNLELSEKHEGEQALVAGRVVKQGGQLKLEAQSLSFGPAASQGGRSTPQKQEADSADD